MTTPGARDPGAVPASVGAAASGRGAYRRAGVDVDAKARAVELIRDLAVAGPSDLVVEGIGGFAGLVRLGDGSLLAASADGVGTKVEVARLAGRLDTVGIDLVAMCANDVVCTGATPLFFLDYLVVERMVPEEVAAIVSGVVEGCRRAGCALLGGETAEHPGMLEPGRFDLAGFCVGRLHEEAMLDPMSVRPGDALVAFRSSGLHSNGFSLARRLLPIDPGAPGRVDPRFGRTLADELLEPTAIYVRPLLALARAGLARAAAHVTGGGIHKNLPRALPPELGAVIETAAWRPQPIFEVLADLAGLPPNELFGVLNMGIGMLVAVPSEAADEAVQVARAAGADAFAVGRVVDEPGIRLS